MYCGKENMIVVAVDAKTLPMSDLLHGNPCRGRSIALDIARGTIYMHNKKIIHLVSLSPAAHLFSSRIPSRACRL